MSPGSAGSATPLPPTPVPLPPVPLTPVPRASVPRASVSQPPAPAPASSPSLDSGSGSVRDPARTTSPSEPVLPPTNQTREESLDAVRFIVQACDRFEAEWRSGRSPPLERAVSAAPAAIQQEVRQALHELLAELEAEVSPTPDTGDGPRPMEILRPLAAGGMGQVSIAFDPEVHRVVALKEILPVGEGNAELRQRFLREAQITGRLEHPGIIPVYSRGRHADGRPYYTMRLISGEQAGTLQRALQEFHRHPLAEQTERDRAWRQLLRRLIDVCNTMAYVHSRGVLHRDLKPANILLGPYGETLVVDWGLARELGAAHEAELSPCPDRNRPPPVVAKAPTPTGPPVGDRGVHQQTDRAADPPVRPTTGGGEFDGGGRGPEGSGPNRSGFGDGRPRADRGESEPQARVPQRTGSSPRSTHGVGTPGYASPEQLTGDRGPLTAASDVYSLGATLYAVLTGRSAFPSVVDTNPAELLQRVCSGDCPRPRTLNPRVEPGLEAICLKAMAVDPQGRYRSPAELAADLECHLAGEPVSAWNEPWSDRLRRWVLRHRTAVLLGTLGLALSTLFLAVLVVVQGRSQRALREEGERLAAAKRDSERNEQLAVAAVRRFSALVARDPQLRYSRELQPLRRELLREPISSLAQLRTELRRGSQPSAPSLWRLRETTRQLAELHREIGDLGEAQALLQEEGQLCEEGRLAPADSLSPPPNDWSTAAAQVHLLLAQVQRQQGRTEGQLREAEAAIAAFTPLIDQSPERAELLGALALAQGLQGAALATLYRLPEAIESYREAIERQRLTVQRLPAEYERRRHLAELLQELAAVLNQTEALSEARRAGSESEELVQSLDGLLPTDPLARQQQAMSHLQRGLHLTRDRRFDEALVQFRQAEQGWRQLVRDFPARNEYAGQLRVVLQNLANLLGSTNQPAATLPLLSELIDREREIIEQSPGVAEFRGNLASSLHQLGHLLPQVGRANEVEAVYGEALGFAQRAFDEFPKSLRWLQLVFELRLHLSDIDSELGRLERARDRLQESVPLAFTLYSTPEASPTDRGRVLPALRALAALQEVTDQLAGAAETRARLRELERQDPLLRQIDARLDQIVGGAAPLSQDERVGLARRAAELLRYDIAVQLAAEALDLEPSLQSNRAYQVGLLAAATATAAAAQLEQPQHPRGVAWRRQARVWLSQELEFWRQAPAESRPQLVASVSGWLRDHRFASVRVPRRLAELPEPEQAEWRELWEAAQTLIGTPPR